MVLLCTMRKMVLIVKSYIYVNDELNGMSKHFDDDGDLLVEGLYKNGKKARYLEVLQQW